VVIVLRAAPLKFNRHVPPSALNIMKNSVIVDRLTKLLLAAFLIFVKNC